MLNIRPVSDLRNKYPEIEQLMRQRRNSFFMIWLRHDLTLCAMICAERMISRFAPLIMPKANHARSAIHDRRSNHATTGAIHSL